MRLPTEAGKGMPSSLAQCSELQHRVEVHEFRSKLAVKEISFITSVVPPLETAVHRASSLSATAHRCVLLLVTSTSSTTLVPWRSQSLFTKAYVVHTCVGAKQAFGSSLKPSFPAPSASWVNDNRTSTQPIGQCGDPYSEACTLDSKTRRKFAKIDAEIDVS